jgi:hypothetical protein
MDSNHRILRNLNSAGVLPVLSERADGCNCAFDGTPKTMTPNVPMPSEPQKHFNRSLRNRDSLAFLPNIDNRLSNDENRWRYESTDCCTQLIYLV